MEREYRSFGGEKIDYYNLGIAEEVIGMMAAIYDLFNLVNLSTRENIPNIREVLQAATEFAEKRAEELEELITKHIGEIEIHRATYHQEIIGVLDGSPLGFVFTPAESIRGKICQPGVKVIEGKFKEGGK